MPFAAVYQEDRFGASLLRAVSIRGDPLPPIKLIPKVSHT